MDLDRLRGMWQAQADGLGVDEEQAVELVLRKSRCLEQAVFRRDIIECGTALAMAALFVWLAHYQAVYVWPWYAAAACSVWIAAFLAADRRIQREPEPAATLADGLAQQVRKVNHQIALLRNVFWWYLLPCGVAVLLIMGELTFRTPPDNWILASLELLVYVVLLVALYGFIWWLNQRAVRVTLRPMKDSLEQALRELQDEDRTAGDSA